jgi:pimeloyl-ACP methyl ester carboxylesterase
MNPKILLSISLAIMFLISNACKKQPINSVISTDGVNIVFNQNGEGNPAIIFVHGWSNSKNIWDALVPRFSEKYKTIAVDLAGFGESGNNRTNWTMSAFGDDVTSIIKNLKLKKVVLVGFSMGAPVVVEAAAKVPENIIGVILVDDLLNIETKYPPEVIHLYDSIMMDLITNPAVEKLGGSFFKTNIQENFNRVLSMLKTNTSRTGWQESLNEYFKWLNEDCTLTLKKIQAPVTAINSDSEPTNVEAFRKYVPSFKAKIIPGVGHVVFWDAPDEFNKLLEESIQDFIANRK